MRLAAWLCLLALLPATHAVLAKPAGGSTEVLSGVVTDAAGKPLPGISVWSVPSGGRYPRPEERPDALTGRDGSFRIPLSLLASGNHVEACGAGFGTATIEPAKSKPGPLKVALRPGPGARIAGRVVDQTGKPFAKFVLTALMSGTHLGCALVEPSACPEPGTSARSQSDADGRFVLEVLQPGWYRVSGYQRGYRDYSSDPIRIVAGQRFDQLVVTLQRGAIVTGSVLSSDGKPVAGARIADARGYFGLEATSDAEGHFRMSGLAPEATDFLIDHPTLGAAKSRLNLHDGENRLDVRLTPDGEIHGRVLGPDGSPVAGAVASTGARDEKPVQTNADGRFVLRAHAGPVIVEVWSYSGASVKVPGVVAADHPLDLEIRQASGAEITGRVTGLKAPWDTEVRAIREGGRGWISMRLDSSEIYHLRHLDPGTWTVQIDDSGERRLPDAPGVIFNGRARRGVTVQVEEGKEGHVDFDFPPVVVLRGRVTGASGKAGPRDIERVSWRRSDGDQSSTWVNADGTFDFVMEPGAYDFAASWAGNGPILLHLDVNGPQTELIELRLGPEIVLTGRIQGLAPGQVAEFVQAEGPNGFPHAYGLADQDGGYRVAGLTPGTWTIMAEVEADLTVEGSRRRKVTQTVTVPPGAATVSQDLTFLTGKAEQIVKNEELASRPSSPCG
jgi:protocatechuate 3,4-dioxygenase beta subunit